MARLEILHISDLHFGLLEDRDENGKKRTRPAHFFTTGEGESQEVDPKQLAELLTSQNFEGGAPKVVVASGDIGWSGKEADYKPALEFLHHLQKKWPQVKLVITPGNHDVDRSLPTGRAQRQEAFIDFLQQVYGKDFETIHPLYKKSPSRDALVGLQLLHETPGNDSPAIGVVVSMNSAAGLESGSTPVRIDPTVLNELDNYLMKLRLPEDALRIFVLHHHLLPFAESSWSPNSDMRRAWEMKADPDLVSNSAKIQGWLAQRGFHLVLHGHKHTSHGREDLLWRKNDMIGRRLLIVGAGSAGVERKHRAHIEPLTFNQITATRFSKQRWQVRVQVQQICDDLAVPEVRPWYEYTSIAGVQRLEEQNLPIYHAEQMDDCHRAIASERHEGGAQYNFLSVVEDATYRHPETASFNGQHAKEEEVKRCFEKLHPEYLPTRQWQDFTDIDRHLRRAQSLYQFEHGSRLFQSPDHRFRRHEEEVVRTSPLLRAISEISQNPSTSKAYVSLYRSDIDVLSWGDQPLPGLMGIHFFSREGKLDLTASFRKIELSFWWCVNMYELGKILRWACGRTNMKPGRITFFASLAEWKPEPEAPVEAQLDKMPISELLPIVVDVNRPRLKGLLEEKLKLTNENNLDPAGLERLEQLLSGAVACGTLADEKHLVVALHKKVLEAKSAITQAISAERYARDRFIRESTDALTAAITTLSVSSERSE